MWTWCVSVYLHLSNTNYVVADHPLNASALHDSLSRHSVERVLDTYVPEAERIAVKKILYGLNQGKLVEKIEVPAAATAIAKANDFDISLSKFEAAPDGRPPRVPSDPPTLTAASLDIPIDKVPTFPPPNLADVLDCGTHRPFFSMIAGGSVWGDPKLHCLTNRRPNRRAVPDARSQARKVCRRRRCCWVQRPLFPRSMDHAVCVLHPREIALV